MSIDRRIRLTDSDLEIIVAALQARRAMYGGARRHELERLIERLAEPGRGNPKRRFTESSQTKAPLRKDVRGA